MISTGLIETDFLAGIKEANMLKISDITTTIITWKGSILKISIPLNLSNLDKLNSQIFITTNVIITPKLMPAKQRKREWKR